MRGLVGAMLVLAGAPAMAATTVLDFSGNICGEAGGQACGNGTPIVNSYGSSAPVTVRWRNAAGPGNTATRNPFVLWWGSAYADLAGVAYTVSTGEARFEISEGFSLTLDSVDVGGWPNTNRNSGVRVYDLDFNLLFNGAPVFPGQTALTVALGQSSNRGLILQWGPDAFNGGIDNLTFTVRSNDTPVIPEPATWALMIAGFGLVGVAARRRTVAAA